MTLFVLYIEYSRNFSHTYTEILFEKKIVKLLSYKTLWRMTER